MNKTKEHKPISINEKKGSCIFFHNLLIHGSSHNISPIDRKTLLYAITSKEILDNVDKPKMKNFGRKERIKFEKNELKKRLKNLNKIKKCLL